MNLTQLPVKLEEAVSSVLKDITPEMKNSFCNYCRGLYGIGYCLSECMSFSRLYRSSYSPMIRSMSFLS